MPLWYVGREANRQQRWDESYRAILRTIEGLPVDDASSVKLIRRSKPVTHARRRGQNKEEFWVYVCVDAPSYSHAERVSRELFERANQQYRVGFGPILTPDTVAPGFLESTEYPTDGRVPPEPPREEEDVAGPFAYFDVAAGPALPAGNMAMERLLAWLSAAGEGRWEAFVRAAERLSVSPDIAAARRLFRRMLLLGHLESSADGRSWSVTPPVLVQAAVDPQAVFYCGSRTQRLLRSLPDDWLRMDNAGWDDGLAPPPRRYSIPEGATGIPFPACTLPPTWAGLTWGGPVAERLAPLLPNVEEWAQTLDPVDWIPPPHAAEVWDLGGGNFRDAPAFRVVEGACIGPAGLYRFTFGDPPRAHHLTAFFDPDAPKGAQLLRGEWYGLRFLALHRAKKYRKAVWRSEDSTLAVLQRQRWPLLFERALVLASGLLPRREGNWLYYAGITEGLAKGLAEHLGVTLEPASCSVPG